MQSRRPELELKLGVPMQFELPSLKELSPGGGAVEAPALSLTATYYDTDDLRLVRNGVTLRYRTGDSEGAEWTLKLPLPDEASVRDEINFSGTRNRVPREAYRLTTAFARGAALAPVARIRTQRRRWSLHSNGGEEIAELADDRVSVLDGRRIVERFREIEVESRGLSKTALQQIASVLKSAGAAAPSPMPKLARALGPRVPPPDIPDAHIISETDPVYDTISAALGEDARRLMLHDPATRLGDVEGVHQMRVAIRRLRSHLHTFRSLVEPNWAKSLLQNVRWLGKLLGRVRDLDVLEAHLKEVTSDLGKTTESLFQELHARHAAAFGALTEALSEERYYQLLESLLEAVNQPKFTAAATEPCSTALPRLLAQEWEPLHKAAVALHPGDPDQKYHRVRILAKEVRYAAEAASPCLRGKLAKQSASLARSAEEIQQVLGRLQDDSMATEIVTVTARQRPRAGAFNFAAGRAIERLALSSRTSKQEFHEIWGRSGQKLSRKWLNRTSR